MKIIVGLSGGVDSAVAAHLLIKQGHQVIGAFMRNWDSLANNDLKGNKHLGDICPQEEDYLDALAVAKQLGIPLLRVDFIKEYWDYVFSHFIEEYQAGRTPNPDVLCNKYIKFSAFLDFAKSQGAEMIATGHYARVDQDHQLLRGVDPSKDQSYFLSLLSKEQLAFTLFPLGELEKSEVRKIALELNLPVAKKKDSTGICFIGERQFRQFLSNYIPAMPGNILDYHSRKIIGSHQGVMYYTLGQRRGLNIGGLKDFDNASWYIVGKNIEKRELYAVNDSQSDLLYSQQTIVNDIVWRGEKIDQTLTCKYRYQQKDIRVSIKFLNEDTIEVTNIDLAKATTPGQTCVFYQGDVCIGGGTIVEVLPKLEGIE